IFLVVAAFLVNVVVSRLVATERSEIGLLKAFGYADLDVVVHYLKLVAAIAALGLPLGAALGLWMGHALAGVYTEFFSFPRFVFRADPRVYVLVVFVTVAATAGGAAAAVRRAARLEPAAAMTPPAPPDYSRAAGSAITGLSFLDQQTRMVLRQIVRFPGRAAFTVAGIAVSGALLVGTLFFVDAVGEMIR